MTRRSPAHLITVAAPGAVQSSGHDSFGGGIPKLPPSWPLPTCKLCGAVQSFFFQIAFPDDHVWSGQTLAVFQCTSCYDSRYLTPLISRHLFPSMQETYLGRGDEIPPHTLELIQVRCRFLVFPTASGSIRQEYQERVAFRPIGLTPLSKDRRVVSSKVGGSPRWIYEDRTPGSYFGEPMAFLMQWERRFRFDLVPDAPSPFDPQAELIPELGKLRSYCLFIDAQLYFFGNFADGVPHVFVDRQFT